MEHWINSDRDVTAAQHAQVQTRTEHRDHLQEHQRRVNQPFAHVRAKVDRVGIRRRRALVSRICP